MSDPTMIDLLPPPRELPRLWWTRHILIVSVILAAILTIVRLVWGWDANRRLQAEIDAIRARGEPIFPEQFNSPPIADQDNYVFYLTQALDAVNHQADPPSETDMDSVKYLPAPAKWISVADAAVKGNKAALQLIRQASQHDKAYWGHPYASPAINTMYPTLNKQRYMAELLADVALSQHLSGNDSEAIASLHDLFAMTDPTRRQPSLICYLVAIGIDAIGTTRVELIAPGLRLADDPTPAPTTQPVTPVRREQVTELIAWLLERGQRSSADAFMSERMFQLDEIEFETQRCLLLRPKYLLDAVRIIKAENLYIAAVAQPSFQQVAARLSAIRAPSQPYTYLTPYPPPAYGRLLNTDFRVRMEYRLAAVSLAARLYQIDHAGQWPPNLEALAPKYLPAVPIDPFSATGNPLGYFFANGGTRPIVYSVGDDGIDDTRAGAIPPPEPQYDWRQSADEWRDLSRFDPPPSTQPAQ